MSYHEAAKLGQQASQLLGNQTFRDVWEYLEAKYTADWLNSREEDERRREHVWRLRRTLVDLKDVLLALERDGKHAAAEIKAQQQAATVHTLNAVRA